MTQDKNLRLENNGTMRHTQLMQWQYDDNCAKFKKTEERGTDVRKEGAERGTGVRKRYIRVKETMQAGIHRGC